MENTSAKESKPQLTPSQEGYQKFLKEAAYNQAAQAHASGVPLEHIEQQSGLAPQNQKAAMEALQGLLNTPTAQQLLQQGQQMVDVPGTMQGPFTALKGLMQGKGYNPTAPWQAPVGFAGAEKMATYDMNRNKNILDAQKTPLEIQKLQGDINQQPLQTQKLKTDLAKEKTELRQMQPGFKQEELRTSERIKRQESQGTQDDIASIDQSINSLNSIHDLIANQPAGPVGGGLSQMMGKLTGGQSNTTGELARQFTPALSIQIYRDMTGDKRTSDQDAKVRAAALVPSQTEAPILQRVKTDFMQEVLGRRKAAIQRGESGIIDTGRLVSELKQRVSESSKNSKQSDNNDISSLPTELQSLAKSGAKITLIKKGSK